VKRRERIGEVRELRARMGEIVRANTDAPRFPADDEYRESLPSTRIAIPNSGAGAPPSFETPLTSRVIRSAERRSSVRRWVVSGVIAATALAGVVVAAQVSYGPADPTADTDPNPSPPRAPPDPTPTVQTKNIEPEEAEVAASASDDVDPKTELKALAVRPTPRPRSVPHPPERARARAKPSAAEPDVPAPPRSRVPTKLADDPYGPE
jgi:hypothetical protein